MRACCGAMSRPRCRWSARAPSPVGEGLQVLVYTPDQPGPVRAHLRLLRQRRLLDPGRQGPHHAAPAMRSTPSRSCIRRRGRRPGGYRDLISLVRNAAGAGAGTPTGAAARAEARPRVAPREELPGHAARVAAPRRAGAALAAQRQRQRPLGPAVRHRPRAGAAPHQPATGQDQHPGRARRRHLPDRRRRAAAQPGTARHRKRSARRPGPEDAPA